MKKLPANLEFRRHIPSRYNSELPDVMERPPYSDTVQYYCPRVSEDVRDDMIYYLAD